jgi:hypothetical protein
MVRYAATAVVPPYVERKDPSDILDYEVDWSEWLESTETLSSATWTVPTGLTSTDTDIGDTTATVWLSGGTAGTTYEVACKVVTTAGRTAERSFRVRCEDR